MFNSDKFFDQGLNNTVALRNGVGFSTRNPGVTILQPTEMDRWFLGDFVGADYYIVGSYGTDNRQIVKVQVAAVQDTINVDEYSSVKIGSDVFTYNFSVNQSYVSLTIDYWPAKSGANVYIHKFYLENNQGV